MMKLSTVSLLATASAANASLRGGPVVFSSKAVLSAIPAIPAPSLLFMADSIGEGDDNLCWVETQQIWKKPGLIKAMGRLKSCAHTVDEGKKTATVDFASCDAAKAANTACSCEFVFHQFP